MLKVRRPKGIYHVEITPIAEPEEKRIWPAESFHVAEKLSESMAKWSPSSIIRVKGIETGIEFLRLEPVKVCIKGHMIKITQIMRRDKTGKMNRDGWIHP